MDDDKNENNTELLLYMENINLDIFGEPDIRIAGLKVWITGRQFPEATDYWDGNWLLITACCESMGARVFAQGPFIHLSEIETWHKNLRQLNKTIHGEAELSTMEPEFDAKIVLDRRGSGSITVSLTPDHMNEQHTFTFETDQSFLQGIIKDLETILEKYPVKNSENG
jgi:hypothetical protein